MMERRCAVPGPRGCGVMRRPCQCVHPLSCRLRLLSNSDSRWEGLHGGRGTKLPVRLSDTQRAARESPPDRPVANAGPGEPEPTSASVPCSTLLVPWSRSDSELCAESRFPICPEELARGARAGPGRPRRLRLGHWLHHQLASTGRDSESGAGSGAPVAPPPALRGAAPCRRRL